MKGSNGLQKALYVIMAVLGIYILYKGFGLLVRSDAVSKILDEGEVQRSLEDAAVKSWAPGYAAAVGGQEKKNCMGEWMKQVVPAYSYLAELQEREHAETSDGTDVLPEETRPGLQEEGEKLSEMNQARAKRQSGDPEEEQTAVEYQSGDPEEGQTTGEQQPGDFVKGQKAGEQQPGDSKEGQDAGEQPSNNSKEDQKAGEQQPGDSKTSQDVTEQLSDQSGEMLPEEDDAEEASAVSVRAAGVSDTVLEQLRDFNYLVGNYFTVDGGTVASPELLDADTLLTEDLRLVQDALVPQILIYHTHSQEAFADSREGVVEDTIVGMGEVLAEELRGYGYNVIHDTGVYDLVDGVLDRSASYDYARDAVQQVLEEHPTIEVIIDLHRDGVDGYKFATEIDGKPTSMIMFFNGISRNSLDQPISYLENPYTSQNLAFSLQLELAAREKYPGFTRNIYLKAERFNLHLRPRSLLVEAGTQLNTVEEERNAMAPLADLLHTVLAGTETTAENSPER